MRKLTELDTMTQIYANLFRVSNLLQTKMDQHLSEITSKQWYVLAALEYLESDATLKDLAHSLSYSHQNVKSILNKLEDKGFIKVEINQQDRRKLSIIKCEKYVRWQEEHKEKGQYFIGAMFKDIDDSQLQSTSEVLNQLYERLESL